MNRKQLTAVIALVSLSYLMAQDSPVVNSASYSKVYAGKEEAFEKAVTAHVSKWHGVGQWNQFGARVMSGPRTGEYVIGTAGHYWKDYDNRVATDDHNKDWARINKTYVEDSSGMNFFVKNLDASYNDRRSPMWTTTYFYCKPGGVGKMINILKKIRSANEASKYERSYGTYVRRASGRGSVLVLLNRMDGMVDMGPANSTLRERWTAKHGEEDSFDDAVSEWLDSFTHTEAEILQLVEGMTTPPSN